MWWPGVGILLALSSLGSEQTLPAASIAPAGMARLDVRAAAGCTSRTDVAARVAARSPRIQFTDDAPLAARALFTATRTGAVVAELILEAAGRPAESRRVVARTCAAAADAVALILAVTLDPTAAAAAPPTPGFVPNAPGDAVPVPREGPPSPAPPTGPASSSSPLPQSSSPQPSSPPAVPAPPSEAQARAETPTSPPPMTRAPTTVAEPPTGDARARLRVAAAETHRQFGLYVAGQATVGPAPRFMPGVAVYAVAALERDEIWAPALILGFMHAWRGGLDEPGGTAAFSLDAASLDACPIRWRSPPIEVRPCASATVGRMVSTGTDTDQQASAARPFVATGVAFNVSVGDAFVVLGRFGFDLTLIRDSYQFGDAAFHRSGRFTMSAGLGLGVRWP